MTNTPDKWVVLQFTDLKTGDSVDKVFAGWHGGYLGGDSWQLNSGIRDYTENDNSFYFSGYSGSLYICYKNRYGMTGYMHNVLANWKKRGLQIKLLENYDVQSTN